MNRLVNSADDPHAGEKAETLQKKGPQPFPARFRVFMWIMWIELPFSPVSS